MTSNNLKVYRWAGISGVLFFVLGIVEFPLWFIGGQVPLFSDEANFGSYVARNSTLFLARTFMDLLILLSLTVFLAGFRHLIRQKHDEYEWAASLFFGIGLIYVAVTLVSDSITGGAALDTVGVVADPTVIRALIEETLLMFGSTGITLAGALLATAAFLILATKVLPRWIGWFALVSAIINFAFIPSMFFGTDPNQFYSETGLSVAFGSVLPLVIWILLTSILMITKKEE
jgi:hypothetical protein